MIRKFVTAGMVAAVCVVGFAGTALADATSVDTWRWDKAHAVRTNVWYDNDQWQTRMGTDGTTPSLTPSLSACRTLTRGRCRVRASCAPS